MATAVLRPESDYRHATVVGLYRNDVSATDRSSNHLYGERISPSRWVVVAGGRCVLFGYEMKNDDRILKMATGDRYWQQQIDFLIERRAYRFDGAPMVIKIFDIVSTWWDFYLFVHSCLVCVQLISVFIIRTCVWFSGPSSDAVLREQSKRGQGCCGILLMIISVFMIVITFPIAICLSLKVWNADVGIVFIVILCHQQYYDVS